MESSQDAIEFLTGENIDRFSQLVHIGHLTKFFEWGGHKFEIRTLTIEEELTIGQLVKEFKDTITEEKAIAVAISAGTIVRINDRDFMPYYDDKAISSVIRDRFNYIRKNWHWPIIEAINANYITLLSDMYDTIEESQNLSNPGLRNSSSTSDPLIEQDLSEMQNT